MKTDSAKNRGFLDGPYARIAALACFAGAVAVLVYIHRDDLFPAAPVPVAERDDPFGRCFREGTASIDKMLAEKTINAEQAKLFRMRAEARCRAQTGSAGGPPPRGAPGLPPVR
jgi:hypothetical protein